MMTSVDPTAIDSLLGRQIAGKLELLELLGSGAMGKVYRAHHTGLDKPVAIKVLLRLDGAPQQHIRRFQAEAKAASRIEHPNSVQILDFGEDQGLLYIAMEYLEGQDLQAVLKQHGSLDTTRICWIMSQVFSALAAGHRRGVIHRDIKPGNIMLTTRYGEDGLIADFVKVCDFGLAKILDNEDENSAPLTKQGAVFGTPAYMSPEQARGEPLDARSDIYSCGVVMYKMITGHTPFRAESPTGVLMKHITEPPPSMADWVPDVNPKLAAVVERTMRKDRTERFQDAREARDALRAILKESGINIGSLSGPNVSAHSSGSPEDPRFRSVPLEALLPPSVPPSDPDQTQKAPPPRVGSKVATQLNATLAPSMLATRVSPPSAALQTLPPPERSASLPPRSNAKMYAAAIPGALALLLVGGLIVLILFRQPVQQTAKPQPPPIQQPKAPAPSEAAAPKPSAPPMPEPAKALKPAEPTQPQKPKRAKPSKSRAKKRPAPKKPARKSPEVVSKPLPKPPPPKVAPPKKVQPPQAPKIAVSPPKASPPPPPSGPPKLELGWKLELEVSIDALEGGLSKRRAFKGLERHLDAARACFKTAIGSRGRHTQGKSEISAKINVRGRLQGLSTKGLPAGSDKQCVMNAFSSARMPRPDTGMGMIRFLLRYRTRPS